MSHCKRLSAHPLALAALVAAVVTAGALLGDARWRVLATNTVALSAAVALGSVLVGAPIAFLLARTDVVGRRPAEWLLLTLLFVPLYVQATAWDAGFGVAGWFATATGGALQGWRGAIAVHTLAAIPWVVVLTAVGLRQVAPELEEEALLDASPGQVFRRVTIRRGAQAVVTAGLWVAVTTAGEMTVADLFLVRTFSEELYTQYALGEGLSSAPWSLLPSLLATGWVVVAGLVLTARLIPRDHQASQRTRRPLRLAAWRLPASGLALGAVALLLAVPVASLAVKAGRVVVRADEGLARTWSAEQCWRMIVESPLRFGAEFGWSAAAASLAAIAAVAVGVPLAWYARRGGWRAAGTWCVVGATLAIPGPLVGLGIVSLFNDPGWSWLGWLYDHTIAPVWIAQTVRALPLCVLVLWYGLRTVPEDLLASATLDGAGAFSRLFRVALPERWGVVAVASLVAFAVAWGELAASVLVAPPGMTTLAIRIFGLVHYGVDDRLAGLSLAVMGLFVIVGCMLHGLVRIAGRGE